MPAPNITRWIGIGLLGLFLYGREKHHAGEGK